MELPKVPRFALDRRFALSRGSPETGPVIVPDSCSPVQRDHLSGRYALLTRDRAGFIMNMVPKLPSRLPAAIRSAALGKGCHLTMDVPAALAPPPLRAHLLGPVRLLVGDAAIPNQVWSRRAARSLLLLLLVTPDHHLPRDRVLDLLWPNATSESADQALRKAVHLLRRVLQPDLRSGRDSAYLAVSIDVIGLRPGIDLWIDAEAFETALAAAHSAPLADRRTHLRQALTLYQGDLLRDETYAEWATAPRERLRQLRRRAALDLTELDLVAGAPEASVPALEQLLNADATDEAVLRALMRALAGAGRGDDALRWYRRTAKALRDELDVAPEEATRALADELRAMVTAPTAPLPQPIAIRPQASIPAAPNLLVGRAREVEQLQDLLLTRDVRLLTVTGPGGVGKTRLAQEAARQVAEDFADGVAYVPLATIRDPSLVLPAIAHALGLAEDERHAQDDVFQVALRGRELLLVLDNLEQVIDAAPRIATLLEACEGLKILATSREPLRVRAEHEVLLSGLSVPGTAGPGRDHRLMRYGAVELFLRRAHAVRPSFVLMEDNAPIVVDLCKRLDGLPLAIELAAAQARVLSPEALLAGLTDRFALLAGGYRDLPDRQQSLYHAISWSYDLLPPPRRRVFQHLAVFAGDFTGEAAVAVVAGTNDPDPSTSASLLDDVDALVISSLLVRVEDDDGPRFSMLESIREYGLGELSASGEEAAARHAHAAWYRALAEEAAPILGETFDRKWLDRLEAELGNFRAALTWALRQPDAEIALRLAAALRRFWLARGYLVEGRDWLEQALAHGSPEPSQARAEAIFATGELSFFLENLDRAKSLAEEGLAICRSLGNARGAADALLGLGHIARQAGDLERAEAYLIEGIALARSAGATATLSPLQEAMARLLADLGRLDEAEALYEEHMQQDRLAGNERGMASSLSGLAKVARKRGDTARAISLVEEALAIVRRLHDTYASAVILIELAALVVDQGDHARATELLRESLTLAWEHRFDALAAEGLQALALLAATTGQRERSARLAGLTVAFCQAVGTPLPDRDDDLAAGGELVAHGVSRQSASVTAPIRDLVLTADEAIAEALNDGSP
jgi:predicted ATPase